MDTRGKKTKERIIGAFLSLREQNTFESITVRKLCAQAKINKSTFYKYFHSLFSLCTHIENEIIAATMAVIPDLTRHFEDPAGSVTVLDGLNASEDVSLLFRIPDDWRSRIIVRLHSALKEKLFQEHPEYRDSFSVNCYITYAIYGGFYAFYENLRFGKEALSGAIARITEHLCRGVPERRKYLKEE